MTNAPIRVLVDTNVWISALINLSGQPARVIDALMQDHFIPVISPTLVDEIREVLARPRIRRRRTVTDADVEQVLLLLTDRAIVVSPPGELHLCHDPDDDFLLQTALLANAQYMVSRDDDLKRDLDLIKFLRESGVEVLSVAQFLARMPT